MGLASCAGRFRPIQRGLPFCPTCRCARTPWRNRSYRAPCGCARRYSGGWPLVGGGSSSRFLRASGCCQRGRLPLSAYSGVCFYGRTHRRRRNASPACPLRRSPAAGCAPYSGGGHSQTQVWCAYQHSGLPGFLTYCGAGTVKSTDSTRINRPSPGGFIT